MGEMVSYLPIDGSYVEFASRFVDNSFGFALGWLVFYNYAVTVAAEATAVAGMINYWNTDINNAVWCTLFLVSIVLFVRPPKCYKSGQDLLTSTERLGRQMVWRGSTCSYKLESG